MASTRLVSKRLPWRVSPFSNFCGQDPSMTIDARPGKAEVKMQVHSDPHNTRECRQLEL